MQPGDLFPPKPPLKKILVRGVNWLGDAVMSTPALQRLREHFPESRIILLTLENLAELWTHHPSIDSQLICKRGENPWSVARRVRAEAFDASLVLPNSPRSALEVWLGQVPHRIGYAGRWRSWFLTQAVAPRSGHCQMRKRSVPEIRRLVASKSTPPFSSERQPPIGSCHQAHEYLHLVAALGASAAPVPPKLEVTMNEVEGARAGLFEMLRAVQKFRPDAQPVWLGLNPSAAYGAAKCWPAERFAAVAREVSRRIKDAFCLVFGGESDRDLCERVSQMGGSKVANLAGQTSLRELMALLKMCHAVLTNDSGPMHVAAALGTPVIVAFGSTSPELTGPGLPGDSRHRLLQASAVCSPCFRRTCPIDFRCMTGITVESAVAAVLDVLGRTETAYQE